MRSTNQIKVIAGYKILNNVITKTIRCSPLEILAPSLNLGRIRPKQIVQHCVFLNLNGSDYLIDKLEVVQTGTQPAMHTENTILNDSSQRQAFEDVAYGVPCFDIESSFT